MFQNGRTDYKGIMGEMLVRGMFSEMPEQRGYVWGLNCLNVFSVDRMYSDPLIKHEQEKRTIWSVH